ncbi:MAG: disulfide bond formation protein DsbA [Limimaricola sp.]|uniref:DsbA family oxidoreductase n=1 Tax=Limimaricola sp. TaxID=2211665 RepID=UPI001D68BCE4|nr:DsbA family protein [Limimaricola sp.]MBI1416278.1 disulfide bond formation protein DsbA [Limimaricola sp.]
MSRPVVQHFSDVLCVWAYVAHVRTEELAKKFEDRVAVDLHFVPVFPDVHGKIAKSWAGRGGFEGYADHVAQVAGQFDHVTLHPDAWRVTRPASSGAAHLFLRAVALAADDAGAPLRDSALYRAGWALRLAFFAEARDISLWAEQAAVTEALGLPRAPIEAALRDGRAMAALEADTRLAAEHAITGSPTIRMNAGRQILYGNVGFRLIEANLTELLRAPNRDDASWC